MNKFIIFMWQIIFAVNGALSLDIYEERGLIYIGSFKHRHTSESNQSFDENDYYVSINPTAWKSAEEDCSNIFGPYGGLVSIETIEEWEFLKELLEMYAFGTTYWSSGKYDISRNDWIWSTNNQPILPSRPWSSGHPSIPDLILRIQIYHTNRYNAAWRTVADTQLHRYICEIRKIN